MSLIINKGLGPIGSTGGSSRKPIIGGSPGSKKCGRFNEVLRNKLQKASGVNFSAHAMDRIDKREISMNEIEARKVGNAIKTAKEKGAKDSLFIGNGYALIVNIPNKTVVTAMNSRQMDSAFVTNIDSTVMVK